MKLFQKVGGRPLLLWQLPTPPDATIVFRKVHARRALAPLLLRICHAQQTRSQADMPCAANKSAHGPWDVKACRPLLLQEQLERAAIAKWGSLAALEVERERRQQLREQRSVASYFSQQQQGLPSLEEGRLVGGAQEAGEGSQQDGSPGLQQQQPTIASDAAPSQPRLEGVPAAQVNGACSAEGAAGQQAQQAQQHVAPRAEPEGRGPHALRWLQSLPPLLQERVCVVPRQAQQAQQAKGAFVLYWMKTAVRGHENPALDAAAAAAANLGLPLLAASFLLASHPYASARRWKFLLEGLRDAQAELRGQVGGAHFSGRRGRAVVTLGASRAFVPGGPPAQGPAPRLPLPPPAGSRRRAAILCSALGDCVPPSLMPRVLSVRHAVNAQC